MRSVDAVDAQADGVGVCGDRMAGGVTCELFVLFEASFEGAGAIDDCPPRPLKEEGEAARNNVVLSAGKRIAVPTLSVICGRTESPVLLVVASACLCCP